MIITHRARVIMKAALAVILGLIISTLITGEHFHRAIEAPMTVAATLLVLVLVFGKHEPPPCDRGNPGPETREEDKQ